MQKSLHFVLIIHFLTYFQKHNYAASDTPSPGYTEGIHEPSKRPGEHGATKYHSAVTEEYKVN